MDFDDELEKAIQRGQQRNAKRQEEEKKATLSAEELKRRHNEYRLSLSDYIETSLKRLAEHFPGFEFEIIYGSKGWGGAIHRNDLTKGPDGRSGSFFSRLEITVKSLNEFNVVNIAGKGTIADKEMFSWNHFKDIDEAEMELFQNTINSWIVDFAEQFAAR
jgi:hypothetical protein